MKTTRQNLKKALKHLPAYEPEPEVWESLNLLLNRTLFSRKLSQLSEYEPPRSTWKKISIKLDLREKSSDKKKNIIRFVRWSLVAAMFIPGFIIYRETAFTSASKITYSEEIVSLYEATDWNEDEKEIRKVLIVLCEEHPAVCNSPEFIKMNDDLRFLDQSKQDILNQLNRYETNAQLDKLLVDIELERTDLIKSMIAKTL